MSDDQDTTYIREGPVELKGKMKWDKFQERRLKISKDAILECWSMPLKIEDGEPVKKKHIELLKEGLNECKPNNLKGKQYKLGWQIQTDRRVYNFASASKEDRNVWIKLIQDTYTSATNRAKSQPSTNTNEKKQSKKWGSALKTFKQTAKTGGISGMGSALKNLSKDAKEIKKLKFREKKEEKRKANIRTLDTSSIFGCYLKDNELKQEEIMEMKQQVESNGYHDDEKKKDDDDDDQNNVTNENPLISITLNEILDENYQTFSSKLGAKASRVSKETLFNDDLIVSNEFCQLAIGKGLVGEKKKNGKDLNDSDNDNNTEEETAEEKQDDIYKKEEKYLKINKRPMYDTSDDECNDENDLENHIVARNEGELREKIDFKPREYKGNFTICCEIYCEDLTAGNTVLSNRIDSRGFELIAPRGGSRRIAIWREGSKLLNVGKTELFQDCWYHIAVVCERANMNEDNNIGNVKKWELRKKQEIESSEEKLQDDKKKKEKFKISNMKSMKSLTNMSGKEMMEKVTGKANITAAATDFSVYLNGVLDGKLSLDGVPDLDTLECRIGSAIDMSMSSSFNGKIKHFEIYDCVLSSDDLYLIAHRKTMMSLKQPVLLSYIPSSLKVEIPNKNSIKYNGPIHTTLPSHLQWQPGLGNFTLSAWIICSRSVSKNGSVVISNLTTGNNGFELICPTVGSSVLGIRCTGVRDENGLSLGTTKIEKNRYYHIAVSVERIITYGCQADQTSIVVYLNGKQDGSYNIPQVLTYKGGEWTIGFNSHYKSETRFEGSINNVRLLQRSLTLAEIACLYAADMRERTFIKDEEILYCDTKQDIDAQMISDNRETNEHLTLLKEYQWVKGIFVKLDMNECKARIKNKNNTQTTISLNKIIKTENKISQFIPGSDSIKISNLGGMIHGKDFHGNSWRIYSAQTSFLKHITSPSCFTLLSKLKPFSKHLFQQMINNNNIDNKYILNRLLNSAHELLKSINKNSKLLWTYFNEYILPWNGIWGNEKNFKLLQKVARRLQEKYKKQQFDLFDRLKNEKNWDTFEIKNFESNEIECRQDAYDGGLTTECDINVIDKDKAILYDQNVSSKMLWGRCFLLNECFQNFFEKLFENGGDKFIYEKGPQKTYERMVEKTVEYQSEGQKFPAAYKICDVLRCSIRCKSLDDIDDAYYKVEKNIKIIRVKNRFLPSFDAVITDGYRDMLCNVLFTDDKTGLSTIAEVQFHLQDYIDIKHKQHKYYKIVRAQNYKALLRNYEARKFDD